VSVIAKYVGVPRSSMYVILERLEKLQLTEHFDRNGITYFKSISPASLTELLQNQEEKIEHTILLLQKKLPQLEALENKLSITPRVRFFEGKPGASKMYEEVLKEKEFRAVFNPKLVKREMPKYFYKIAEALKEKSGRAKEFVLDSPEGREYQKRFHSPEHQIKILPASMDFPSDTIICKNKIYMIAYGEGQISATEIINPSLAQTQRTLFEELWKRL
jgi:sugar-specific transcriptional regulator TrmB